LGLSEKIPSESIKDGLRLCAGLKAFLISSSCFGFILPGAPNFSSTQRAINPSPRWDILRRARRGGTIQLGSALSVLSIAQAGSFSSKGWMRGPERRFWMLNPIRRGTQLKTSRSHLGFGYWMSRNLIPYGDMINLFIKHFAVFERAAKL